MISPPEATVMTREEFCNRLKAFVNEKGDGRLDKDEIRDLLRCYGKHFKRFKVWRAMKHADLNRDNFIDGDKEFQELAEYACRRWGFVIKS